MQRQKINNGHIAKQWLKLKTRQSKTSKIRQPKIIKIKQLKVITTRQSKTTKIKQSRNIWIKQSRTTTTRQLRLRKRLQQQIKQYLNSNTKACQPSFSLFYTFVLLFYCFFIRIREFRMSILFFFFCSFFCFGLQSKLAFKLKVRSFRLKTFLKYRALSSRYGKVKR